LAKNKSAIKRHKQSEKRRARNAPVKTTLKTAIKKVRESVEKANAEEAKSNLKTTVVLLDRAVTKRVLHRNSASRRISRLTKAVNSMGSK
jgi:small subunit ribosomal protein S20